MWLLIFSGKQWEQFRVETVDVKDPVERVDLFSDILSVPGSRRFLIFSESTEMEYL